MDHDAMTVEQLDELLLDLNRQRDALRDEIVATRKARDAKVREAEDAAALARMSPDERERHLRLAQKIQAAGVAGKR